MNEHALKLINTANELNKIARSIIAYIDDTPRWKLYKFSANKIITKLLKEADLVIEVSVIEHWVKVVTEYNLEKILISNIKQKS